MVHQVMAARDGAADEASQLSRQIQGLNIRVATLTEELDKSNEMRTKLEINMRKQIMEELRQKGMLKDSANPASTSGVVISPEKEKYGVFTAELGRDALLRASAQRDPVTAMRELRESLVKNLNMIETLSERMKWHEQRRLEVERHRRKTTSKTSQ